MTVAVDPESAVIRIANEVDAAPLAEFAERCFRDTFASDIPPADMEVYVAGAFGSSIQRSELADPGSLVLLAECDGQLAGYAHLRRKPIGQEISSQAAVELKRFYVARAWHGLGLAQRLMSNVLRVAEQLGDDAVWLAVWEWNARAISFYTKCGFADAGAQPFQLASGDQTDRIMIRRMQQTA